MAFKMLLTVLSLVTGLAALAIAIYEHVTASNLSLPIPPALTILTILLPIIGAMNTALLWLARSGSQFTAVKSHPLLVRFLQALQALLTTVLGTVFVTNGLAVPNSSCTLTETWQQLYSAHDSGSIRRIQDGLDCCGLNTVNDRAWPFPTPGKPSTCKISFSRSQACRGPWAEALRRCAGGEFGVVVLMALFQVFSWLLARWAAAEPRQERGASWGEDFRRRDVNRSRRADETTRLLPGPAVEVNSDEEANGSDNRGLDQALRHDAWNEE